MSLRKAATSATRLSTCAAGVLRWGEGEGGRFVRAAQPSVLNARSHNFPPRWTEAELSPGLVIHYAENVVDSLQDSAAQHLGEALP